jgi:CRISPR system Cascade subunit CasB
MEQEIITKKSRGKAFVEYALVRMQNDTAFGAALRRADNPATEYQAWEYLANWCAIDNQFELFAFAVVSAALARAKPGRDGFMGLGQAIAACYSEGGTPGNQADAAKSRLRRVLACSTIEEVCRVLRPVLSLIASRGVALDYGKLLDDLLKYGEWTRQRWAVDFYGRRIADDSDDVQSQPQ